MAKGMSINDATIDVEEVIEALIRRARDPGAHPFVAACSTVNDRLFMVRAHSLSKGELASLYALLAYTAHQQDAQQETVQAIVEAQFNVRHISAIKAGDFSRAVTFIADLRVSERTN